VCGLGIISSRGSPISKKAAAVFTTKRTSLGQVKRRPRSMSFVGWKTPTDDVILPKKLMCGQGSLVIMRCTIWGVAPVGTAKPSPCQAQAAIFTPKTFNNTAMVVHRQVADEDFPVSKAIAFQSGPSPRMSPDRSGLFRYLADEEKWRNSRACWYVKWHGNHGYVCSSANGDDHVRPCCPQASRYEPCLCLSTNRMTI
jgi:hypothetical protein